MAIAHGGDDVVAMPGRWLGSWNVGTECTAAAGGVIGGRGEIVERPRVRWVIALGGRAAVVTAGKRDREGVPGALGKWLERASSATRIVNVWTDGPRAGLERWGRKWGRRRCTSICRQVVGS